MCPFAPDPPRAPQRRRRLGLWWRWWRRGLYGHSRSAHGERLATLLAAQSFALELVAELEHRLATRAHGLKGHRQPRKLERPSRRREDESVPAILAPPPRRCKPFHPDDSTAFCCYTLD